MDLIREIKKANLKEFLLRQGFKFQGDLTLCPFHSDTKASLSVSNKDGVWLWHCFGCNKGGSIIDFVMEKEGVSEREVINRLKKEFNLDGSEIQKPRKVAEYPYLDESGNLLFKIIRYHPKSFQADRKMKGVRQVLYRLPEVLRAEEVWLVEGEKDADNLSKLGLVATTAPFGVNHWKDEFSDALKGKKVRICLDIGTEKLAERRAASITRAGASEVKIIGLPGLEKEGQDISDWIEMQDSKTNEELREWLGALAAETPAYELPGGSLKVKNSFLNTYINSVSEVTDAPEVFILFSALGLLSGICNKHFFYYPRKTPLNLYILLLAPSTFYRKSVTIDIATDYLNEVDKNLLLPESFTSEALLEILSKHNRGLLTWRELIQVKEFQFGSEYNRGLPSLLTDLFDFKPRLRRWTKGEGETTIEEPILSILAAGISTWLVENLKKIDFQGGIWTRFLFVPVEEVETRKFRLPQEFSLNEKVVEKLKKLNALEPQRMNLSKIYPLLERWGEKHQEQTLRLDNDLLKASFQRLEVALLKIACLLQLAGNESTTVEPETFQQAAKIIEWLKRRLPEFFEEEVRFTESERALIKIKKLLRREDKLSKGGILRRAHLPARAVDEALKQLMEEEQVKIVSLPPTQKGGRPGRVYQYIGEEEENQFV